MNYKETLFFIGKCLSISHEEHNRKIVEQEITSGKVDWDNVVKLSTKHYVFPALYCNLKRVNFLHYLPNDLVEYMQHITDLNRERNLQIIEQAKQVNELLLANNITPIFLKGVGNLLEGLYEDIAERMVGDIDFIVSKNAYNKTIQLIKKNNYRKIDGFLSKEHRHYPKLVKKGKIAALEIHKELLIEKHTEEFNYEIVKKDLIILKNVTLLSFKNQLSLSIIAQQINDAGQQFNTIALRNSYDVFLLSKRTNSLNAILKFKKLFTPLNNFLAITEQCFSSDSITYMKSKETENYLIMFTRLLENPSFSKKHHKKIAKKILIKTRITILTRAIYDKKTRIWLVKRLLNGRKKLN